MALRAITEILIYIYKHISLAAWHEKRYLKIFSKSTLKSFILKNEQSQIYVRHSRAYRRNTDNCHENKQKQYLFNSTDNCMNLVTPPVS